MNDYQELVKRLRADPWHAWMEEAANAIEALVRERDEAQHDHAAAMRASLQMKERAERAEDALRKIEEYVAGRVQTHIEIAEAAGSGKAEKKQRVRQSEASDILGKIRKVIE